MIDRPQPWDLIRLDAYVEAVLQRMADNRHVMADGQGEPCFEVIAGGIERGGRLRLELEADCSAIGMPVDTPITVRMEPDAGPLAWSLGNTLIATTGRHLTPEEVGDALSMDALLNAHRKWVTRGQGPLTR